jgi:putative ABC transport system permease protein
VKADARLTNPRRENGARIHIPRTGLVMSRRLAELLDVHQGEEITIVPIRGRREPIRAPIVRLADGYLGLFTYADYDYLNRLVGESNAVSTIQMQVRPGLEHRLRLFRRLKDLPAVQAINDNVQGRWNIEHAFVEPMRGVVVAMVLFAGAIFFGSILTMSLVSIAERRREVATFLVMGFDSRQVGGIFLRESMLVNVIGALIGLPMGLWLILILLEEYSTELYRIPLVLTPVPFGIAIALSVAFTLIAHVIVQRVIARMDWREALNARE